MANFGSLVLRRAFNVARRQSSTYSGTAATAGGHGGGVKLWKSLSFFVALPGVGICMLNAYLKHQEESHEQPEFVPYEHLRIRTKRFPWGDGKRSLFHNPHVNALPDGYEEVAHH
ncbi:Cytochrome c oxidase subunit 6A, mitochondrial [Gryllus bimaculatus]|nr:Cytochrome c oxidase subunit 6A, mitochondrial [Gryllus bimaculatus]